MKRTGIIVSVLFAAGVVLLAASLGYRKVSGGARDTAGRVERTVERRMKLLDGFIDKALQENPGEWMHLKNLPEDMVVYRYVDDTLQSWNNRFTLSNDDIRSGVTVPCLVNPRMTLRSPLADVTEDVSFVNMGPKWYLVRKRTSDNVTVMAGLEADRDNPWLHLSDKYSTCPLNSDEGSVVCVDGVPQFKVSYDSMKSAASPNGTMVWLGIVLILVAAGLALRSRRTLECFGVFSAVIVALMLIMYFWGRTAQEFFKIFSPTVYADGEFLYSLGAVLVIEMAVIILVTGLYFVRADISRRFHSRSLQIAGLACGAAAIVSIAALVHCTLKSIILNSNISLEIYKISEMSAYSLLVYIVAIGTLLCIPLIFNMMQPAISRLCGHHADMLSGRGRIIWSVIVAVYMVILSSVLGFRKEQDKVQVWAGRLGFERDISLELQLRVAEARIANDIFISSLSMLDNSEGTILNRISETYLSRIYQDYDVSVVVYNKPDEPREKMQFYSERLNGSEAIADGSRFVYSSSSTGMSRYTGVFLYYSEQYGLSRMLLCVDPIGNTQDNGYARILGRTAPGKVLIPAQYSYAKYKGADIQTFRGSYAYSTVMSQDLRTKVYTDRQRNITLDGYLHFVNLIAEDESVIISRSVIGLTEYLIAVVLIALVSFLVSQLAVVRRRRRSVFGKNYYKTRITAVLMSSLILTLVAMCVVSVLFVYSRNDDNRRQMMSDKINSIQALMQQRVRNCQSTAELGSSEVFALMESVGANTGSDITLYSPGGQVFMSTVPELYDRMLLGLRIDGDAYEQVVHESKRYFINRETVAGKTCYNMYAPLLSEDGTLLAILCSPFADESYDFESDAVIHSLAIISVFIILLLLARFMSAAVVDRMFKPLSVMGRKMSSADINSLEYIDYDRDDEITTLVDAYNRMVTELSESTRKLAQAERDKAWSGMARQVAHEIKNPLMPMKLQIQRIIRLKGKGDPTWQTKFDEAMTVILDHIDILSETANEFSTFAKLYTEEPSPIDLDRVLQEEIAMFDNREDINFTYFGLAGSVVMGPKPQLTRVFVNLINNAVQALDGRAGGQIIVSLRNSVKDGFYDIVVEDNGPGVSEENISKLFTPNFTTKTSGSGLGLAISRNILEKCGATISYSRSFALGGACFTVVFPK